MVRRIITILLGLASSAVWTVVAIQLAGIFFPRNLHTVAAVSNALPAVFVYKADFRDPFTCSLFPAMAKRSAVRKEPAPTLPECKIGGIVYNPVNPMVLFLHSGKSDLVKKGDMVDSMVVKEIWQDSILVIYRKARFVLRK